MKKWMKEAERGQIMVILVAGVIALLGFTALSVDMGQYYSDRRYDQNAADDSALAGASKAGEVMAGKISIYNFSCEETNTTVQTAKAAAIAAAQARATTNNFTIAGNLTENQHGVEVTCDPVNKNLKIHVMISSDVETSFAHFVFSNGLHNTVEAVTIIEPGTGLGEGMAIVALEKDGCGGNFGGLFFGGNSPDPEIAKVVVNNSSAHSNSCLICEGSSVTLQAPNPMELVSNQDTKCDPVNLKNGTTITHTDKFIDPHTPTVICSNTAYGDGPDFKHVTEVTLSPGNYKSISVGNGKTLILNPGLYCINGTMKVTGGNVKVADLGSADPDDDDGVTIYARDTIDIDGGEVNLRAPRSNWKSTKPASYSHQFPTVPGLLFYLDPSVNNATLTLNGNAGNIFRGTIYYPTGEIKINGTSSNAQWFVEVIGNEIVMTGNANINITYDGSNGHPGYPYISFQK